MAPYGNERARKRLQGGIKKMESSLTPVQRAARKILTGGRPPSDGETNWIRATTKAMDEIDRAAEIIASEGLDPETVIVSYGLAFTVPAADSWQLKWMPGKGQPMTPFLEWFEKAEAQGTQFRFLGVIWVLADQIARRMIPGASPISTRKEDREMLKAGLSASLAKHGITA